MVTDARFPFEFAAAYRAPAFVLGVTPTTAFAEVSGGQLRVRFGLWRLVTSLGNVAGHEQTGPFSYVKTVGPPHLSFVDRGVTFATNGTAGLCVRFHDPVSVLDPTGHLRHPGATLTVADPTALAAALDDAR